MLTECCESLFLAPGRCDVFCWAVLGCAAGTDWLLANGERLSTLFPQLHPKRNKLNELQPRNNLDLDEFTRLLQVGGGSTFWAYACRNDCMHAKKPLDGGVFTGVYLYVCVCVFVGVVVAAYRKSTRST